MSWLRDTLPALEERYSGPTLIYRVDEAVERVRRMCALAPLTDARFLFSIKAFPDRAVLSSLVRAGLGLDAANASELDAAASLGERAGYVSVTGPSLGGIEPIFERLQGRGTVVVNVDSAAQYDSIGRRLPSWVGLGARIKLMPPTRDGRQFVSRFGVSPDDVETLRQLAADPRFVALHAHVGNEDNDRSTYREMASALARLVAELGPKVRIVNVGGGVHQLSEAEVARLVAELRELLPRQVSIVLEPGNFWFQGAGFALCRILSVRRQADAWWVVTDLSRDCHLRWSDARLLWPTPPGGSTERMLLSGPTCYEADLIGSFNIRRRDHDTEPQPGRFLVLSRVSSYAAAWNTSFNGIPKAEVMLLGVDG